MIELLGFNHRYAITAVHVKNVAILDVCEAPHIFEYFLCRFSSLLFADIACQDREFVAAEAGYDANTIDRSFQLIGNLAYQAVPGRVTTGIVDIFELVEINEQQCTGHLIDRHIVNFLLEFLDKATSIKQARQSIMISESKQACIPFTERGCR